MLYLTPPEAIESLFSDEPDYRADQLRGWLYDHPVLSTDEMTNLPVSLRTRLEPLLWPFAAEAELEADGRRTRKWLFRAPDGAAIEAVLMAYPTRTTLCLSSQAGCAMACTFCATGQFGFDRHLDAGEIVAQVAYAEASLRAAPIPRGATRVSNIVFMGMGEPLANYDQVREALRRMIDIMGRSPRSLTVSTVGHVPGMRRLADEGWPVNLAVSLHAADDALRNELVPLNRRYPIADVVEAAAGFFERTGRRVSLEWTLMAGVNDTTEQAAGLAQVAHELRAHVNLIALNPTPLSPHRAPDVGTIASFAHELRRRGVNATVRTTRGQEIDAACGQLRVRHAGRDATAAAPAVSLRPVRLRSRR